MSENRLKTLNKALQLENDGMRFYAAAMEKSTSQIGRQMFDYLRLSEKDHIKRITDIYHALEQSGDWPQTAVSQAGIEQEQQQPINTDDLAALQQAAQFERSGEHFYAERAKITNDRFEQIFYQQLAREEEHHLRAIEDSIQMLEDPQGFFAQYEKGTLAG